MYGGQGWRATREVCLHVCLLGLGGGERGAEREEGGVQGCRGPEEVAVPCIRKHVILNARCCSGARTGAGRPDRRASPVRRGMELTCASGCYCRQQHGSSQHLPPLCVPGAGAPQ